MGCETSDIMPFLNSLDDDSNQNPQKKQQQRPQPQQGYPAQQQQAASKAGNNAVLPVKKKKPVVPREKLENKANLNDDFLTHHLKYELSLSSLVTTKRIQKRQILEHIILQNYWGNVGGKGVNIMAYFETAQSAWMQRTFLEIWEVAHDEFFNQHVEEKAVRKKIAESYMYELYELKEYVDAGLGNLNALIEKTRSSLFEYLQYSDDGLFNLFKKLKDRYPQTGATEKIKFPDVPSTKTKENLLNNFPSKAYVDPPHLNLQTIYEDISLLLKKAIELQDVFKDDMRDLLGQDALACPKVTQVMKDGVPQFNACAVRRVFIKWAENLLQSCPDLQTSKPFLKFIKAKSEIANNFFFKSTVQKSTHKIVIDTICYLIEVAKYSLKDQSKRKQFMFNIYDLLRCKVKRNTPEEIVQLFRKLESTKVTKSGTKFQLLRVKNRFETNNRDLLVNFRYGDILVGEAQLCIDNANVSKITKLNYEFCHYIYELERSLFGPTLELMMQYEDFQRPDISVSFEAEDLVDKRGNQMIEDSEPTERICMQGHGMIGLVGNYFIGDDPSQVLPASCNFCDRVTSTDIMYDYCFHCSCFLCRECTEEYKKYNPKESWLSVQREEVAVKITDPAQIATECAKNKSLLVLFYIDDSSASQLFKDSLIYHQGKLLVQPGKYIPKIALANCSVNKNLINAFKLTDFPTFILFDSKAKPVRTLVGYSWLEVPFFYETQRRLISGESIEIQPICAGCAGQDIGLQFKELPEDQQLFCLNCFNINTPTNDRIPQNYHGVGGFCSNGHYRCISCCYSALDVPSGYRDPTGVTYLSNKIVNPKLTKCSKGHVPKLTYTNTLPAIEYQCYNCKQNRFFDNQSGVGVCEQCKVGLCPACMGFPKPSLTELDEKNDLAVHYVESTAQEGTLCACDRHFKKVYKTRMLSIEELVSNNNDPDNKKWKCFLCQRFGKEGDLHVACFACPALTEAMGKKTNFEICMTCATKSELLMREPEEKIQEEPSFFMCPSRHKMVYTSIAYDQQLTFNCKFCNKKYFGHTQRVHCKTCKFDCCEKCIGQLANANPPRCNQHCRNHHELRLLYSVNTLKFCDGCMKVIRREHFDCEGCSYQLCLDCSNKGQGFVGTAFDDFFKAINGQGQSNEIQFSDSEQEEQQGEQQEEEEQEQSEEVDFDYF